MLAIAQNKNISSLLEEGYVIADNSNLYGVRKKVPKSHETDFDPNEDNFGHFTQYSINSSVYTDWIEQVIATFEKVGLQSSKLRVRINEFDPSMESNLPAQKFMRALREIEKIAEDPNYLNSYVKINSLPPVKFHSNTLSQGVKTHKFQPSYAGAISFLWDGREIRNHEGVITRPASPKTQSMFEQQTGIKKSQFDNLAKALRQVETKKDIRIQLKYPRNSKGVFLVVHENNS